VKTHHAIFPGGAISNPKSEIRNSEAPAAAAQATCWAAILADDH